MPKGVTKPYYAISVTPGNKTVRKRSDQAIGAQLLGFTSPKVQLFAKYASASQWEGADMRVEQGGTAYQFLIAGVPESLEYYVEAGGVRSQTFKLNVVDLPSVKKVAVTFHYPAYLGLKDTTEDPGGDLRAVQGTVGEVSVTFDKPLASGEIVSMTVPRSRSPRAPTTRSRPRSRSRRTECITSPPSKPATTSG